MTERTRPKPMDYDELFPGRFLKAGLFKGKKVTLTIADVETEELPQDTGKDKVRGVISFKETERQLVLNSTNGQCFKAMFGRKVQDWVGKSVTLCAETDKFGRETVEAVRVYGGPDIDADMSVDIQLPRRKPKSRVLHCTRANGGRRKQPEPKPDHDFSDADNDGRPA